MSAPVSERQVSDSRGKIAVIGGGVGALTAAFELSSPKRDDGREYDITVYQMGWRLGGKGASGRNRHHAYRIEEHGLHIWMGWYHNAFRIIKECYEELDRSPNEPLATWQDAFKPHSFVTLMDHHHNNWKRWDIAFPATNDTPGSECASALGQLRMLWGWLVNIFDSRNPLVWCWRSVRGLYVGEPGPELAVLKAVFGKSVIKGMLKARVPSMLRVLRSLSTDSPVAPTVDVAGLTESLRQIKQNISGVIDRQIVDEHDRARRLTEILDLASSALLGLIEEGVAEGRTTFAALDDIELRDFLARYDCHPRTMQCAFLRAYYNMALAYRGGDSSDPQNENTGAGTATNIVLRGCFGYRGAFMWEMQSAMGDTIFAPLYEVLRQRGVKFKFFHKVERLELSQDGQRVERIKVARQVDVHGDVYDPLIEVKGLPCWPSEPLFDQIVQGVELQSGPQGKPYNLESHWSGWTEVGDLTLERGEDFDDVVLGIPPAALEQSCQELIAQSDKWRAMIDHVETVPTQAVQLWLKPEVWELGWEKRMPASLNAPERTVAGGFAQPLHTWADLSHLADREDWPAKDTPKTIAYFCGTISDNEAPPISDSSYPFRRAGEMRGETETWLAKNLGSLWQDGKQSNERDAWDWNQLVDPARRSGADRFASQYWRVNIDPSERYVQTIAGSTRYRLRASDTDFDNVVVAGDWTHTGICGGCVEVATMSGLQAARAISGYPSLILGEDWRDSEGRDQGPVEPEPAVNPPETLEVVGSK